MVARNREFLYAIARGRRRSHDHRTKNPSPAQRPGADPGTAGRTAGGIPPGCVPLGAGRNIARYPKPAAPQGGPGRIHRHAAGLHPGLGGEPAPQAGLAPAAASPPARPSLGALLKRRFWLLLLPVELVLFVALAVWRLGKAPSLALLLLVQGLWLCLLLYLLLLVVYFLVWGIRYFQRHTRPPQ